MLKFANNGGLIASMDRRVFALGSAFLATLTPIFGKVGAMLVTAGATFTAV